MLGGGGISKFVKYKLYWIFYVPFNDTCLAINLYPFSCVIYFSFSEIELTFVNTFKFWKIKSYRCISTLPNWIFPCLGRQCQYFSKPVLDIVIIRFISSWRQFDMRDIMNFSTFWVDRGWTSPNPLLRRLLYVTGWDIDHLGSIAKYFSYDIYM